MYVYESTHTKPIGLETMSLLILLAFFGSAGLVGGVATDAGGLGGGSLREGRSSYLGPATP